MLRAQKSIVTSIADTILTSLDQREVLAHASELLGQAFAVSRSVVVPCTETRPPVEWSTHLPDPALDAVSYRLAQSISKQALSQREALVVDDIATASLASDIEQDARLLRICSFVAIIARFRGTPVAVVILYQGDAQRSWYQSEVDALSQVCYYIGVALHHTSRADKVSSREVFYRTIAETSAAATLVVNQTTGVVEYISPQLGMLCGLDISRAIGESWEELLRLLALSDDQATVRTYISGALTNRKIPEAIEIRMPDAKQGDYRWIVLQRSAIVDGSVAFSFIDISRRHQTEDRLRESEGRYRRLVEHSDAIIFHTNRDHEVTFISRRALDFFGISPEDFVARDPIRWFDLIHPDDRERVRTVASASESLPSFDEEFRIINRITGQQRWLLVRVVPGPTAEGTITGWDGFGIDITSRREAQEALVVQSKKVRALYTVSAAIRGYIEPANIAMRGLQALCDATGADAGVCYLFAPKKQGQLGLVAHSGFAPRAIAQLADRSNFPNLCHYVATHGQAIVVPDIKSDPRARSELAEEEGIISAAIVPIAVEDEVLGTVALFSKQLSRFDGGDVMLVSAAASQIGLASRQADLFAAYKRQTRNLAALYRMSHELSKNLSLDDIFFHAFSVIRDELGLKRLWLGLLNETGTRITGQAAYGPGLRRRLVDINVEVSGRDHPIARAVRERAPVVIDDPDEILREFGVKRIFSRLAIKSVVLVPLITSGQVLGVLTVQPGHDDETLDDDGITLLRSLANEIAAVLLAKRFEERIVESDKMRTAGLLAAGIAHNFNNMLQAIMGQASLLEMQATDQAKVKRASRLIGDAATKGAALVKQLMSFAQLDKPARDSCDVNYLVERTVEPFSQMIGSDRDLRIQLERNLPRAFVDGAQIRQIISNLLLNAFDATGDGGTIEVRTEPVTIDQSSPHYEVPYGDYVRVHIKDTGLGMDEETRRRCFEPFFTTKNVDPGSGLSLSGAGLGLAASYALARRNGGCLLVESRPGTGTIFTLYLPVAAKTGSHVDDTVAARHAAEQPRMLQANNNLSQRLEVSRTVAHETEAPLAGALDESVQEGGEDLE